MLCSIASGAKGCRSVHWQDMPARINMCLGWEFGSLFPVRTHASVALDEVLPPAGGWVAINVYTTGTLLCSTKCMPAYCGQSSNISQ